jgi:hypothetical protein
VELIGVYLAACLLLAAAGAAKALHPDDTARALATMMAGAGGAPPPLGLAGSRRLVRAGALAEGLLGLAGLMVASRAVAVAVAASYAAFGAYVAVVRHRGGPLATCGCFGTPDTPATRLHVVVDLGLALAALAVATGSTAIGTPRMVAPMLGHQPWHGVPLVFGAIVCAWICFHVLSTLPRLQAARHPEAR